MGNSKKKQDQLGMPYGTAAHRLRKLVLFSLIRRFGLNTCYRCNAEIETVDDMSIEHIHPWLDSEDPQGLFFDLDNIAFSHLKCNSSAARRHYSKCGSLTSYSKGCRCNLCREAKSKSNAGNYTPEKRKSRYLKYEKGK